MTEGKIWRRMEAKNLVPGAIILDAPNQYVEGEEEKYGANGYVTLEFDDTGSTKRSTLPTDLSCTSGSWRSRGRTSVISSIPTTKTERATRLHSSESMCRFRNCPAR